MKIVLFCATIVVGTFIGLLGSGGGALMVPLLLYFGMSMQQAVAVSLFLYSIPNGLPAFYLYYKQGYVNWPVTAVVSVAVLIGVFLGAYIGSKRLISELVLYRIFTIMLICLAVYMSITRCGFFHSS
jgi:uncharacterized membrane protein YfcA